MTHNSKKQWYIVFVKSHVLFAPHFLFTPLLLNAFLRPRLRNPRLCLSQQIHRLQNLNCVVYGAPTTCLFGWSLFFLSSLNWIGFVWELWVCDWMTLMEIVCCVFVEAKHTWLVLIPCLTKCQKEILYYFIWISSVLNHMASFALGYPLNFIQNIYLLPLAFTTFMLVTYSCQIKISVPTQCDLWIILDILTHLPNFLYQYTWQLNCHPFISGCY